MMAGVFGLVLIFITLGKVGGIEAQHTAHPASDVCPYTWQFYSATSKKCECGSSIHGAVLCNSTTKLMSSFLMVIV